MVSVKDSARAVQITDQITRLLRERRKLADTDDDNFNVMDTKQIAETLPAPSGP